MTETREQFTILQRIAGGDRTETQRAVQECLDQYGGLVWSLVRRWSFNQSDAEDAVQEIFIDLWKSAGRYDAAQASEATFVAMIARRRLIDRRRVSQRQPEMTELNEEIINAPGVTLSHSQQMELSADAALAARAMSALRPEQQQVLQLAIYQGLSHQEIATSTGLPLGTVKTYVRRGLLHIRQSLGVRKPQAAGEVS
jgi:RNA polymerase sigma-70 factor (ECF subfamily)